MIEACWARRVETTRRAMISRITSSRSWRLSVVDIWNSAESSESRGPTSSDSFSLRPWWVAALLAALALTALYRDALRTPFLSDDHQFLEEARDRPFLEWITRPDPLGGYFRPLSRQVYFELLHPLAERNAAVLHAA